MINRDSFRELASLQSPEHCAVTFYYQPSTPKDQSHREDAIRVKDLVKNAQRENGRNGRKGAGRGDLARIADLAENLNGNHSRAKAIFACESAGIWREFDLPPLLTRTELLVNRRFHLRPLAALLATPKCCVTLIDRKRARIFEVWADEVKQVEDITDDMPRVSRSDGFGGYDAGHIERHIDNFAQRHFDNVCERLLKRYNSGNGFNRLLIGCRDELWGELEPHLHTYLREVLLGHQNIDVATATPEQVREVANASVQEAEAGRREGLVRELIGEAQRNGRGAVGLRHVLNSLERGEVQSIVIGNRLEATVVECGNCGHLDTRTVKECAICGQATTEIDDVADALISQALRNGAEVIYVSGDEEFARAGNVGALLRFRADQNTEARKVAS